MIINGLAADYDGTLASDGIVSKSTFQYLRKYKESGRYLILVTGRELDELKGVFPGYMIFDRIVAENGALIYNPESDKIKLLTPAPSLQLVDMLRQKGVERISVGKGIIATWRPHEEIVMDCIRILGLELQVIFNKDAVMILPSAVNKASGLKEALTDLRLIPVTVAAVGDAENDHSFLKMCGYSAAVSNAIDSLKAEVNLILKGARGEGVVELIKTLLATTTTE